MTADGSRLRVLKRRLVALVGDFVALARITLICRDA